MTWSRFQESWIIAGKSARLQPITLRRCPRVHAVGVSPSPYAPAEIVFSGRVPGPTPAVTFRDRHETDVASRRRGQPWAVAGSVSVGVNHRLGLARGLVADRIPGVPPRSAAHPFSMHGRPSRPKKSGHEVEGVSKYGPLTILVRVGIMAASGEAVHPGQPSLVLSADSCWTIGG